jgi:hypothetical protein
VLRNIIFLFSHNVIKFSRNKCNILLVKSIYCNINDYLILAKPIENVNVPSRRGGGGGGGLSPALRNYKGVGYLERYTALHRVGGWVQKPEFQRYVICGRAPRALTGT